MKKLTALIFASVLCIGLKAQTPVDTLAVIDTYRARLDSLAHDFVGEFGSDEMDISNNPLYFRLFMPMTLYRSAIADAIEPENDGKSEDSDDLLPIEDLNAQDDDLMKRINETLVQVYLDHPDLVQITETELMGSKNIEKVSPDQVFGIDVADSRARVVRPTLEKRPEIVVSKPHYWKTYGKFSGKYTQSKYSDNWYQGGKSNHSLLASTTLEAKYAKKNTNWDNKLEMKLGYYTTDVDGETKFKTNDDLLRFTTKWGLKAWKSWNYTAQIQAYTQFMPVWDNKVPTKLKSKFMAPAYANLALGMDYKPKFKNKDLTLSVIVAPYSYDCRYSCVDSIATNFGIEKGKNFKKSIGSKIDTNLKWKFLKDFTYNGKMQYYTTFKMVQFNFENTLDYKLNKYFSLQLFVHWRFDDSVKKKAGIDTYHQYKELLTLNFNYSW